MPALLRWMAFVFLVGSRPTRAEEGMPPYKFYETPLPYRVAWGPYTVSVEATGEDKMAGNRVRIFDAAGQALREIDAEAVDKVDFPDLAGTGRQALRVATDPGNNILATRRTYCFTYPGGLRNVLVMPDGFTKLRDLDHDGRPELVGENPAPLEYSDGGGLCHAAYPPVYLILRWNGKRYTVANQRFPTIVRVEIAKKKRDFLADLQAFNNPQGKGPSWDYLVGDALGIWADLASIGQEREARRWLLPRLPHKFMGKEFLKMLPDARARLVKLRRQVRTNQSRAIRAPSYLNESDDDQS